MEDVKADETLDARGLSCPMPVLKTKKAMDNLKSGQVLEIYSTDPGTPVGPNGPETSSWEKSRTRALFVIT
jgi:TusA-related sulfurtransferase